MTAAMPRLILTALIAALLVAVAVAAGAAVPRDAGAAAANPRILGVALVAGNPAKAGTAIVYNATGGVAICVSGKCRPAEKSRTGVWNVTPRGLPTLVRGQRRRVFVVATSVGGAFSIFQETVTVR